jgi:son of sevenless-like protein
MQANLDVVCQTLDSLLAIGHDQADLSQGDYNGSIEWRMSRISIATPTQSTHRPTSGSSMIDIATAFNARRKPQASLAVPSPETLSGAFSDQDMDSGIDEDSQSCI